MINESIFNGKSVVIPMADVQHVEKRFESVYENDKFGIARRVGTDYNQLSGIQIITDKTKWNFEFDTWENAIWLGSVDNQAQEFLKAWCQYRAELENLTDNDA